MMDAERACACCGWPICLISVGIWAGKRADRGAYCRHAHKILCSAIRRNTGNCNPIGVPRRTSRPWPPQPEPAGRARDAMWFLGGHVGRDVVPLIHSSRVASVDRGLERFGPTERFQRFLTSANAWSIAWCSGSQCLGQEAASARAEDGSFFWAPPGKGRHELGFDLRTGRSYADVRQLSPER
jgi:hypothetical protein